MVHMFVSLYAIHRNHIEAGQSQVVYVVERSLILVLDLKSLTNEGIEKEEKGSLWPKEEAEELKLSSHNV